MYKVDSFWLSLCSFLFLLRVGGCRLVAVVFFFRYEFVSLSITIHIAGIIVIGLTSFHVSTKSFFFFNIILKVLWTIISPVGLSVKFFIIWTSLRADVYRFSEDICSHSSL